MTDTLNTEFKVTASVDDVTLHDFLSTIYGATQDDFRLYHGDETTDVGDDLNPVVKASGAEPIYVSLVTSTGEVPFLYTKQQNAVEDAWQDLVGLQATAALYREDDLGNGVLVCAFALAEAACADDPAVVALSQAMGCDVSSPASDFMATPGANDWRLVHLDKTITTPIADLVKAYDAEPAAPVVKIAGGLPDLGRLEDATIRSALDLSDPFFDEAVTESTAPGSKVTDWRLWRRPRGEVLKTFCRHTVQADKDGYASVLGMTAGTRGADDIRELWFVGLDIDSGFDGDTIAQRIMDSGLTAILASTHSHMTTKTEKSLSFFEDWGKAHCPDQDLNDDVMKACMLDQGLEPAIVETLSFERIEVRQAGKLKVKVAMTHAPIPKWRIIVPLDSAFVVADNGPTQDDGAQAWRGVPRALAAMLGDLPIDSTGCDVNRLFYHPAHRQGAPWRIDVFGGRPLDWRKALQDFGTATEENKPRARRAAGAVKGEVHQGLFDARWAKKNGARLMISDMMVAVDERQREEAQAAGLRLSAKDRLISGKADVEKKVLVRCPFEDGHSKAAARPTGTFVVNPGVSDKAEGFVFYCSHDHCKSKSRTDFLNKMLAVGTITAEDVQRACEMLVEDVDAAEDDVDVEAALAEYAGITTAKDVSAPPATRMAGGIAINGVRGGLAAFDAKKCLFTGPNAAEDAIKALSNVVSVVKIGSKARVVVIGKDGLGFSSESDAKLLFKPYRAAIEVGKDKAGQPKMKEVAALDLLLASDRRKTWEGIDCDPSGSLPKHVLNTWEGIEIEPKPGDCSLLLAHILNSTCAGNEEHNDVLIKFFAHMVQQPKVKPQFAPVVIGAKGCGKSTVADFVRRAIGRRHSVKIAQAKHLTGNFNAHLAGMLFCQAEEVTFGGDKKGEGTLKDTISAKSMLTEKKGLDAYEETNFTRFYLVSNPGHAVPASDGERRWFVLYAHDLFAGKPMSDPGRIAYFNALYNEADNGGIAAFLDYLMHYDLGDFSPYAAPETEGLGDQVRQSFGDEEFWIEGILESGLFKGRDGEESIEEWHLDEPLVIASSVVIASYNSHVRRFGGSSGGSGAARRALEAHGAVGIGKTSVQHGRKPAYTLGTRREWRDRWMAKFGTDLREEG